MVIWGGTPIFTKLGVREIDPVLVGVLRTVVAGALGLPLALAIGARLPAGLRAKALLAVSGLSGFVMFPLLFSYAQQRTSAMHGTMILAAMPVLTGAYAAVVERVRPTRAWLAGSAIALAGEVALIALRGGHGGHASLGGDLLVVLASLVVPVGYVAGAKLAQQGYPSFHTTLWGVALAAVVVLPVLAGLLAADGLPHAGFDAWGSVAFLGVVTSILGYVLWYWALARGGIARIGTIQFLQPFSGLVLAALILDERFTAALGGAAALILVGITVAQVRRARPS